MTRYGLRDDQWERIKDLLPGKAGDVGVTARDNRRFVEAVVYRYRAGIPWRDLPERFGDWKNTHRRFSVGAHLSASGCRCRQRIRYDRQHHRSGAPAQRWRSQKNRMIGRSATVAAG